MGNLPQVSTSSLKYDPPFLQATTLSSALRVALIICNLLNRLLATNLLSEQALIEYLDESSRAWESCILASSNWHIKDQNDLLSMLDLLKQYLSVIALYSRRSYH